MAPDPGPAPIQLGVLTISLEENKDLVRRFFAEAIGPSNADAVGEFLVPKSFLLGSMQKLVAGVAVALPGAQVKIEELFGEGDKVTACVTMSGMNSGPILHPILHRPPTNKELTIASIWVFTVRNGRVISMQSASDMAEQLLLAASTEAHEDVVLE